MADVQTTAGPRSAGPPGPPARPVPRVWAARITPGVIIAGLALLAFGLRLFYVLHDDFLFNITEYDDGSYLGSAIRLLHGQLPYRDFVFVQPPGITLLLTPVAAVSRFAGSAVAMAVGRIVTVLVSTACVVVTGLLVRHRGRLAVVLAAGVCAVLPDSSAVAHTIMVEPWLALFCLLGALAVFDGDQLATGRRVLLGGLAFGVGGAVEAWAIFPVLVVLALTARRPRRALVFAAGVAAGFLVLTAPLAAMAPQRFYQDVITAQIGHRAHAARVWGVYRLSHMTGLYTIHGVPGAVVLGVTAAIIVLVVAGMVVACRMTRRWPSPLDWFTGITTALIALIFWWPPQFYYHFVGFLAPFLGLSVGLSVSALMRAVSARLTRPRLGAALRWATVVVLAAWLAGASALVVRHEGHVGVAFTQAKLDRAERAIPPGSCVLSDAVSVTIALNRFWSTRPGCPAIDDGTGANLALSHGLGATTGAGRVPAVANMWMSAFRHAQFVMLSYHESRRVPWTPALRSYFRAHFRRVPGVAWGLGLFQRR